MHTSFKDEEMLTMNKALMDLIMDGQGPDGSDGLFSAFFRGQVLRSRWNSERRRMKNTDLVLVLYTWYYLVLRRGNTSKKTIHWHC